MKEISRTESFQINTRSLTFNPSGPVDRSVLTESLQRSVQRGRLHPTGRQHSQELRLPLGVVPGQQELALLGTASQHDRLMLGFHIETWQGTNQSQPNKTDTQAAFSLIR